MLQTYRTALTCILLVPSLIGIAHLNSACSNDKDSTSSDSQKTQATPENKQPNAMSNGTIAVSPEALFDFLHVATQFEFWNCVSSDNTMNTYVSLDSKDDESDEGFNPLLLLGRSRKPQLPGDPRARNDNEARLETTPVSYAVTGSDTIAISEYEERNPASGIADNTIYLTAVRTGPGRAFTAEDKLNNTHITCTAENVGADIML